VFTRQRHPGAWPPAITGESATSALAGWKNNGKSGRVAKRRERAQRSRRGGSSALAAGAHGRGHERSAARADPAGCRLARGLARGEPSVRATSKVRSTAAGQEGGGDTTGRRARSAMGIRHVAENGATQAA